MIEALLATADAVTAEQPVLAEETECILRWLEQPGTRLVHASHPWLLPAHGAGGLRVVAGHRRGPARGRAVRRPAGAADGLAAGPGERLSGASRMS